jgi:hypothetical protein
MYRQNFKSTFKPRKRRTLIIGIIVACLLLVGILEAFGVIHVLPGGNVARSGPTAEEKAKEDRINADQKQAFIEDNAKAGDTTTTPQPPAAPEVEVTAQTEANDTVTIFTKLTSVSAGTCTVTITNGGRQFSQTANVVYQSQYSICAGFSVPVSKLGKGTWNITLNAVNNGQTASKTITHEVQ